MRDGVYFVKFGDMRCMCESGSLSTAACIPLSLAFWIAITGKVEASLPDESSSTDGERNKRGSRLMWNDGETR